MKKVKLHPYWFYKLPTVDEIKKPEKYINKLFIAEFKFTKPECNYINYNLYFINKDILYEMNIQYHLNEKYTMAFLYRDSYKVELTFWNKGNKIEEVIKKYPEFKDMKISKIKSFFKTLGK